MSSTGGDQGDFWAKGVEKKQREKEQRQHAAQAVDKPPRRRRSVLGRILLYGGGALLLLIVMLVILAPTIAGALAPGIIQSQAAASINGTVKVDTASLSWSGPQSIGPITVVDKDGKQIAKLRAEVTGGLLGLATGGLDLGTVTISGASIGVVRYADGSTNIERLTAKPASTSATPPPAGSSSKAGIPNGLRAKLVVKNLDATFTDEMTPTDNGVPVVAVSDVDVTMSVETGKPLTLELAGGVASGSVVKGGTPTLTPSGKIDIKARVEKWTRADGTLNLPNAYAELNVVLDGFPVGIIDTIAGGAIPNDPKLPRKSLAQALGSKLNLKVDAKGTLEQATAQMGAQLENASAQAAFRIDKSVLTGDGPSKLAIRGSAIAGLVPAAGAALKATDAAVVDAMPDVTVDLQSLRLAMPKDGAPMDFRSAAGVVVLGLSEITGKVQLAPGQPMQPFRVAALQAKIDAPELAKGAKISASSAATINGQPAGDLNADFAVAGLVGKFGALGRPSGIQGEMTLKGVATAIAQPFVQSLKLNLPEDLGPTLDVSVKASANSSASNASAPPTELDVIVQSRDLKISGALSVSDTNISTRGPGMLIEAATGGRIAQRLVGPDTGWSVAPGDGNGSVIITARGVSVPRDANGPVLDKASGAIEITAGQLLLQPIVAAGAPAAKPIDLRRTEIVAELRPGSSGKASLKSQMQYAGAPFTANGSFDLMNLFGPPAGIRAVGTLDMKGVPTAAASVFVPVTPATAGSPAVDIAALLADAVGATIDASVTMTPEKVADAIGGTLRIAAPRAKIDATIGMTPTQLELRSFTAESNLTPDSFARVMKALSPDQTLRLASPSTVKMAIDPLLIPVTGGKPDFVRAAPARIVVNIPGTAMVAGVLPGQTGGKPGEISHTPQSEIGVQAFEIRLRSRLAPFAGAAAGEQKLVQAEIAGTVLGTAVGGGAAHALMVLNTTIDAEISNAQVAGPAKAQIRLTQVDMRALEDTLGRPGLFSGAVGNSGSLDATATLTPGPGAKFDPAAAVMDVTVAMQAQRLQSDGPLTFTLQPDRIEVLQPARFHLNLLPEFLNGLLGGPAQAGKAEPPPITLREPAAVSIAINKLRVPRGASSKEKPGGALIAGPALQADIEASIPTLSLLDAKGQAIKLSGADLSVQGDEVTAGKPVKFRLKVANATMVGTPNAKPVENIGASGSINNLVDAAGNLTVDRALLTGSCDLPAIPTMLVDSLSGQNGLLVEALGEAISLNARADQFPLGGIKSVPAGVSPTLNAQVSSPRATASISGVVRDGAFVLDRPLDIKIVELIQPLSDRFIKGLPMLGSLEKTAQDAPATVGSPTLSFPLDNDMTKLNGEVKIDPGEARFGTSGVFANLLKVASQKTSGSVGQRLEPLMLHMNRGVITYDRWKVPLGQFTLETEGTIDLVNRTIDVTTFAPFGALADQAAGKLNTGIGSALGRNIPLLEPLSMIPIRTRGSLDDPTTSIDAESVVKEAIKNLRPDELLKKGLGDGLKDLLKPKVPGKP